MAYKLKQRKKPMGSEMKFGVNVSAPFIGMKQDEGSDYHYAKHVSDVQNSRVTYRRTAVPRVRLPYLFRSSV